MYHGYSTYKNWDKNHHCRLLPLSSLLLRYLHPLNAVYMQIYANTVLLYLCIVTPAFLHTLCVSQFLPTPPRPHLWWSHHWSSPQCTVSPQPLLRELEAAAVHVLGAGGSGSLPAGHPHWPAQPAQDSLPHLPLCLPHNLPGALHDVAPEVTQEMTANVSTMWPVNGIRHAKEEKKELGMHMLNST